MHPYGIDQLARDRWEELSRISRAAKLAKDARRRRRSAAATGWRLRFRSPAPAPARQPAAVIDLRDHDRDLDRESARAC